jgi:uncharacterized protein (TIGR02217 family)
MFHETRFPTAISRAAHGGPERRTDVIVLGSGAEERNARWADSRRSYNAGYGVKSLDDLHAVIAFFEERRGRLHGFRWRDPIDWKSCAPEGTPTALDQVIGTGDGTTAAFLVVLIELREQRERGQGLECARRAITFMCPLCRKDVARVCVDDDPRVSADGGGFATIDDHTMPVA